MVILLESLILSSSLSINKDKLVVILLIAEAIMSIITAFMYKLDKAKAKKGSWRISEATLLLLPWLMGGIGGLLGVYSVRHKTKHWYFLIGMPIIFFCQLAVIVLLFR